MPDLLGGIAIELIDADLRPIDPETDDTGVFQFRFRGRSAGPGAASSAGRDPELSRLAVGPGGDALDVQFFGAEAETLKAAAEALKTALAVTRGQRGRGQPGL